MQRILQAALHYFMVVFGAGFFLGIPRTLWLEPWLGKTIAVAIEVPLLIVAMIFGSIWAPKRVNLEPSPGALLGVGFGALFLQQCADIILSGGLRGQDLASQFDYLLTPAGKIYLGALAAFAFMPILVWVARRAKKTPQKTG